MLSKTISHIAHSASIGTKTMFQAKASAWYNLMLYRINAVRRQSSVSVCSICAYLINTTEINKRKRNKKSSQLTALQHIDTYLHSNAAPRNELITMYIGMRKLTGVTTPTTARYTRTCVTRNIR